MSIACYLVIEEDSPFNFAFEMLFGPNSGITAVKSTASNFQELLDEVCDVNPQVVILEDTAVETKKGSLTNMLVTNPEAKIIIVLRDSNYIHVFRKDEVLIQSSSDFLNEVRSTSEVKDKESANI